MQRLKPLHFDGWTLDPASGELARDDVRVRLQRQPQLILEELLARPGEVVTREELTALLWPRAVVEFDMALNSAVRRLRTALRDDPERPRYVETVPRRGYRYIGPQPTPAAGPAVASPVTVPPATMGAQSEPQPDADTQPQEARVSRLRRWGTIALLCLVVVGAAAWQRRVSEMPALQAEIATAVADELGLRPPASADGPVSSDAYERYALARHLFRRRGPGDAEAALRGFSDVVAMEPGFAAAWAGLASANWIETVEGRMDPAEGLPRVRKAAERALALDPRLSEAHLRLALFHRRSGNPRLADEHVRRALAAEPNDPLALMCSSDFARRDGRIEDSVALYKQAVRADPLSAVARQNLAWLLFRTGQADQARVEAAKLLELYPGREDATSMLCLSLVAAGRPADALAVDQRLPSATPERAHCRALALAGLGRSDDAQAALAAFVRSPGVDGALQVAEFYAQTGDVERAFDWLRKAVQRDGDRIDAWMIRESPLLGPLRKDARLESLLAAAAADRA
jgi:DNA-binding winged helix-turn-helix (wHTH) protein/Tfp pilus assembly protein PilF